ncbi:MAG: bifunctional nuclease family protein [Deltaproteobacteria bacterium]|nr:bifunctional nuclease family protein [Deltaproteobacteria bacterium]
MTLENYTEMKVFRLVLDPETHAPIVILQDEKTGWLMPIWIGLFEAQSIAMRMEGIEPARPMTHDLFFNFLEMSHTMLERVEVSDLVDNTYFARIFFFLNEKEHAIDSRPSDAIALALRSTTPIFVANHVLEKSKIDPAQMEKDDAAEPPAGKEKWERVLQRMNQEPGKTKLN